MARLRHNGATSEVSATPAATVQPVSDDRAKLVISGTPSSETVGMVASVFRNISAYSDGEARMPTVACGFGTRAKLTPSRSKIEIVQCSLGRCCSINVWNSAIGGLEGIS